LRRHGRHSTDNQESQQELFQQRRSHPQPAHQSLTSNTIINNKEFTMNMTKRVATALFTATVAFTIVGCTSTPHRESTGEYVDDSVVTGKVKAAIFNEPSLKATEINVETYKGDVQLSGFVAQAQDAQKAAEVARGIKGVNSVKNDIRVK
jgi:osmotically-inducible protein OsmY